MPGSRPRPFDRRYNEPASGPREEIERSWTILLASTYSNALATVALLLRPILAEGTRTIGVSDEIVPKSLPSDWGAHNHWSNSVAAKK